MLRESIQLSCDSRFQRAFTAFVSFSKSLPWLAQTSIITLKTQTHAVNARRKRLSQPSFKGKKEDNLRLKRFVREYVLVI